MERTDADVIVIGAGAAGLAAARFLASRSARVLVLEARDRIGGRVWWRPLPDAASPVELGAEFIHGKAPHTTALLREAGLRSIAADGDSWRSAGGHLHHEPETFTRNASIFDAARSLARDESVERYLQRFDDDGKQREQARVARYFVEGFDAADPAIASAKSIAAEWRSGVDSTISRPLGSYQPMFQHLARACAAAGVRVSLSTMVRHISWQPGIVSIDARLDDTESRRFRARAAVVTVPVGVLRYRGDDEQLSFEPELPSAKVAALASIEMGHVVRVVLSFDTAFWEHVNEGRYRDAHFFRSDSQPFPGFWTQVPQRERFVVAWAGGPKAIALRGVSPTELVELARNEFGDLFGQRALARERFAGAVFHDWARDPHARGAYSYIAVGGGGAREMLAEPVDGTLFFAGEATARHGEGGTVNGALESGERAAAQAAAALGIDLRPTEERNLNG
ncbi:MAG: FAD-dependent oxidoreductase [Candidatus Eremiobacteraeota bacterium]|nr:FAD-dependent oxidoreductase [Candidatus Eremiobacteraeota bacterium]